MQFSVRWLQRYADLDMPVQQLLNGLTMAGLAVEGVIDVGLISGKIVAGEILDIQPHSTAKKLHVCSVQASSDPAVPPLRIVCGAPGMKVGDRVPVALPGAILPGGRVIERCDIRGEWSEGMLCSGAEVGWNKDGSCLLQLDAAYPIGEGVDALVDVGVTPNRPDCLSLLGIARDMGAYFRRAVHPPKFRCIETMDRTDDFAKIAVEDKDGCPRYTARVVRNVRVGPSPVWLARAVEAAGIRSINNIVDVTNFVLIELGHPLHAFDLDKIAAHTVIVRRAREGEKLVTLDGVERTLTPEDVLITDPTRPIALAGIMGGENSEISDSTINVLLESAYFDPVRIRKTRRRLDIQTDASFRFERGTDRENIHVALNRAAQLVREVAGGEITRGFLDVVGARTKPQPITLRIQRVNDILGADLEGSQIADILVAIKCEITHSDHHQLVVVPPSHRVDLLREIDLIEEIGRLYGYERIRATVPYLPVQTAAENPLQETADRIGEILAAEGLSEVVTYSFTDRESLERARQSTADAVELVNPLSRQQSVLRTSLLVSFLDVIAHNRKHGNADLAIFEVAKSYHCVGSKDVPYQERQYAMAALAGRTPTHWSEPPRPWDFFDIKGIVERVLRRLGAAPEFIERKGRPDFHPGRTACFTREGRDLCVFGQVNPEVAAAWEIRGDIFLAEFDLEALAPCARPRIGFRPLGQFPAVVRDLALVADRNIPAGELELTLRAAAGDLLESLVLFDVYEGDKIPEGKRSLAWSLTLRAPDRTLTDGEINTLIEHILSALAGKHRAELRTL